VYFIPLLYLFGAYIRLERRHASPLGRFRVSAVGVSGAAVTLIAMIVACVPPTDANVALFEAKVLGGALFFVVGGIVLYAWRHRTIAVTA